MTDYDTSLNLVAKLVKQFRTNLAAYHAPAYKEAYARQDLIDPLFIALGWDVHNEERAAPQYRQVILEDSLEVEGEDTRKAPDYAFRIGETRKFFAEAKKPGVALKTAARPAYQLRRYAWSAKLPLSLLTDFEELGVYDCRSRPSEKDKATAGRINYYAFEEYPDRWREIWDVFSREAVWGGSFDKFTQAGKGRGTSEVDAEFLREIEGWRDVLAHNMALRNPHLSIDDLNDAVQRTIDRIIFLRMAEDRHIEPYEQMLRLATPSPAPAGEGRGGGLYTELIDLCRRADARYNAGLFDLSSTGDRVTPTLTVDDKVLKPIITGLYFPQSPYEFSVLPIRVLGDIYEQFLGKVIRLTAAHQAKVEEKPEIKKAGGVKYTPEYIVDYIVKNTVGKMAETRPEGSRRPFGSLRVLDMACGSGSFLLGAYQFLLNYYLRWYVEHQPEKHTQAVWKRGDEWRLTIAEKKRILTTHIFGVDIDRQAVEVTKLSLLLKVLEGESTETLQMALPGFQGRALPNLDNNVKCGNSLIGPDYFTGRLMPDADELRRVNPFDWEREFPDAMKAGGFDCIIGNPPYVRQEGLGEAKVYFQSHYKTFQPTADLYVNFIEKGHRLLKPSGLFGMIVSNKWLRAAYGRPLREFLADDVSVFTVVDLAGLPVFGATVRTIILISSPKPKQSSTIRYLAPVPLKDFRAIRSGDDLQNLVRQRAVDLPLTGLTLEGWTFSRFGVQQVIQRIRQGTVPLKQYVDGKMFRGVVTGLNEAFIIDRSTRDRLIAKSPKNAEIIKPVLAGRDIRRYAIEFKDRHLIFTRRGINITRFPAVMNYLEQYHRDLTPKKSNKEQYGRKPGRYEWYEIQDTIDYYAEFEKPKIIYPDIATTCRFALDRSGYFGSNTTYFIPSDDLYLLGILNSKMGELYFSQVCAGLEGSGTTYLRFFGQYIEGFPVHRIKLSDPADVARHDRMVTLVEQMLELNKRQAAATSQSDRDLYYQRQIDAKDREIDRLVYDLYGLTQEEIKIVEGE